MEKEKEINPDTDALVMIGVPGSDEEAYEVIDAFKKVFNAKTKAEEGIYIGKIDDCMHMNGEAVPTAPMYGALRFIDLYDIDSVYNIGDMIGEMRGNVEVQGAIETLEKYTFTLFLDGDSPACERGIRHEAGMPIEKLIGLKSF